MLKLKTKQFPPSTKRLAEGLCPRIFLYNETDFLNCFSQPPEKDESQEIAQFQMVPWANLIASSSSSSSAQK